MKPRNIVNLVGFIVGLLLFTSGAYLVFPPAGLIAGGLILMGISLFGGNEK